MLRYVVVAGLIFAGISSANAQTEARPAPPMDTPPSQNGIIKPPSDATSDSTVKAPNVDPGMSITPPGTAANGPRVVPK